MTSNTSFQPLLACKVSFEKSADSLMGTPLQVTVSFSLDAFKILSLSLILGNVIMMCLNYTTPLLYEVLRDLSKKKKKVTNINSKMTTNSQLSTNEPKRKEKQLNKN